MIALSVRPVCIIRLMVGFCLALLFVNEWTEDSSQDTSCLRRTWRNALSEVMQTRMELRLARARSNSAQIESEEYSLHGDHGEAECLRRDSDPQPRAGHRST